MLLALGIQPSGPFIAEIDKRVRNRRIHYGGERFRSHPIHHKLHENLMVWKIHQRARVDLIKLPAERWRVGRAKTVRDQRPDIPHDRFK